MGINLLVRVCMSLIFCVRTGCSILPLYWIRQSPRCTGVELGLSTPLLLSRWVKVCLCEAGILTGPLSNPFMTYEWLWSNGGMILTEDNRWSLRSTCPTAALSTINPTWTDLGASQATAVRSRWLTARAMAWLGPSCANSRTGLQWMFKSCLHILLIITVIAVIYDIHINVQFIYELLKSRNP
jgi:hypothetical protein